jgi:hypothetical protein
MSSNDRTAKKKKHITRYKYQHIQTYVKVKTLCPHYLSQSERQIKTKCSQVLVTHICNPSY